MSSWRRSPKVSLALLAIRLASRLVPAGRRAEWVEEWESELWHLVEGAGAGPISPLAFCRGVWPHALYERRTAETFRRPRRGFLGSLIQDVHYTLRSFRTAPLFYLIAVATLSIGIGATTVIFSVVDAVLLRPLPYRDPARLVVLGTVYENSAALRGLTSTSGADFLDWRERSRSFEAMAGVMNWRSLVLYGDEPERVRIANVSSELFSILGLGPSLGRMFAPEEYELGSERVAILSHALWQRRFGGDPSVIGRTITDAEVPFTVIGVMPEGLTPPEALWVNRADLWMTVDFRAPEFASRSRRVMRVVARLAPGVTLEAARQEMDALSDALLAEYPDELTFRDIIARIGIEELHRATVGDIGERLYVLLGAVGLLLLIACGNVANLMIARGTARKHEMALRAALGAGRSRLARQLVTESLVVAVIGGTAGAALAFVGVTLFSTWAPADLPRLSEVTVDYRLLAFSLALSVVTGLSFGLVPARLDAGEGIGESLKGAGKASFGPRGSLLRRGLVVTETALAMMLLVGAGLLMNSFVRLHRVDPGFEPKNVFAAPIRFGDSYTMEARARFVGRLIDRVTQLPGVRSASAVMNLPIGDVNWRSETVAEGVDTAGAESPPVNIHMAYPGYFETLGIPLLQGRDFTDRDRVGQVEVAIVNESLARLHWSEQNAVGRRLRIGIESEAPWLTVIGVIGDVRQAGLASTPIPELYRAYPQAQEDWMGRISVVARHDDGVDLAPAVRSEIRSMDAKLALSGLGSLEDRISRSIREPRFYTSLLGSFALVSLLLAGGGIYGTVLFSVEQRTREVGIRMALGARAGDVTRMVVRQAMAPVGIGLAAGLMGSMATSHVLESFLFGVSSGDLPTFVLTAATLAVVGWGACLSPARRAARTDPVTTLRAD